MPTRPTAADTDRAEQQAAQARLLEEARRAQAEHRPEPGVPARPTGRIGGQR
jgi:hypothetical protein